jgi:ADP-ribose pyrophosphatase YjhB (NUDIX family)
VQFVTEEQRDRLVCSSCRFIHYLNPRVVASVVPELDGGGGARVLLMRRALEPRRGFWTPPGGFVELGESTEEGGRALHGEPLPGEEALEARWFTPGAIPWEDLAFETTVSALRDWTAGLG